ncbi:MAG: hypothetical protein ACFE89_11350 [Candidatus Hodarchaeota archaeon]
MTKLTDADEYLHEVSEDSDWRESWYFNWVDLKSKVSGFTTIGVIPHQPKREFVFALFVEGNSEFYFAEPKDPLPKVLRSVLSDDTLSYELIKPFNDWGIHYTSTRVHVELRWQMRFPPYDFGAGSGTSWQRHFEQSGIVTGHITYPNGQMLQVKGYGQRDKSWGVRDWHIDNWFALQAQFDELMIGLRYDTVQGKSHLSGCISSKEGNVPLTKIQVTTQFEENTIRKPVKATSHIRDQKGRSFTLQSQLIHPLSFARYSRQFDGGETELFEEMVIHECEELNQTGTGLAEWLFTHLR